MTQAPSVLWYFARAAGFVSLALLAAATVVGIALSLRLRSPRFPTFVTEGLHRYLSTVLLVFIGIHVLTLWLDPFAKFSVADMVIPLASTYKTLWMALGIVAAELTVALAFSVYIRRLVGYRAWRVIHHGTYALFPLGVIHGIATGTDSHRWWAIVIYAVTGFLTVAMVFWRAGLGSEDPPPLEHAPAPGARVNAGSRPQWR